MPTDSAGCTADTVRSAVMLLVAGLVLPLHARSGAVLVVLGGLAAGSALEDYRAALHDGNRELYRRLFAGSLEPCGTAGVFGAVLMPLWVGAVAGVCWFMCSRGCAVRGTAARALRACGGVLLLAMGAALVGRAVPRLGCGAARGLVELGFLCHPALPAACYVAVGAPLAWLLEWAVRAALAGARKEGEPTTGQGCSETPPELTV